ncbi:hypothetical protein [Halobacillus litoralis]|uniref:hypothetical protein n=1 Tax=Halobacillus litoralis TaxID=45668 RepID=UPI001CD37C1F|nr:hypothetical protein [Halobacillus litoralis]MCA1021560.1 hypothetical protein [Halobacillus litoralis]
MEIVGESTLWGSYLFAMTCVMTIFLFFLVVTVGGILMLIEDFNISDLGGTIIAAFICIFMGVVSYVGWFQEDPTIQYKAVIEDFNVVYDEGYTIVGEDGDLYVLEKE